jgi:F-type H+-transporting ATPase subunit gamma
MSGARQLLTGYPNQGKIKMASRRNLERHRHSLAEIRNIMNSMKTLAYMETRKLAGFLDAQQTVVKSIEEVAADFLSFHPETLPATNEPTTVNIVIGSERGFCGDFNHALLKYLETTLQAEPSDRAMLIAIGHKLYSLLQEDERVVARLDGVSVTEEVTSLLNRLVGELTTLQQKYGVVTVYCFYQSGDGGIVMQKLLPPFEQFLHRPARYSHPPLLNQSVRDFMLELTEHYLMAALHEILYTSLAAENHQRVAHLDGAVKHLDDESAELTRQCHTLRQEEIIEEIEVILLSAASLGAKPGKHSDRTTDKGIRGDE